MARETLELLDVHPNGVYVDLTFGGGGHSRLILEQLGRKGKLYGFDQDEDAKANAPDDPRFEFVVGNFRWMRGLLRARGVTRVDGILADLGVSSHHFDTAERGFSFRFDAPLDMRMNRRGRLTAARIVNEYPPDKLTEILGNWGEIQRPWKTADCIVRARPVETIGQLIDAVKPCTPRGGENKYLSKLFQALRIEVNGEMDALAMMLDQSARMLGEGGRLVVMSYHSLEDRMVKNFMRAGEKDFYGRVHSPFELLTRHAVVPTEEELIANPRSRSAKLRASKKNG